MTFFPSITSSSSLVDSSPQARAYISLSPPRLKRDTRSLDQRVENATYSLFPHLAVQNNDLILLPSEEKFESPVSARISKRKRKDAGLEEVKNSPLRKRLFYGKAASTEDLSGKIDEQNRLIEDFLNTKELDDEKVIVERLNLILNSSLTNDEKFAELGCLYFFLTRDLSLSKVPEEISFLEARYNEISKRLKKNSAIHAHSCPQEFATLLPSGNVVDLMRPCARLIFTPNGVFNPGGCAAVKILLNTDLALVITEEMRAQMLTIVDQLQTDKELYKLFLTEHSKIHPDTAELIRLDLFLSPDEAVGNLHACWAKLIAFFFVISQVNEDNCFAIAIAFDFFRQQPRFILGLFTQMIEKGSFSYNSFEIPVSLLMESRKRNELDFDVQLHHSQAVNLESFAVVRSLFGGEEVKPKQEANTLENVFSEQFSAKQAQAKQQYLAFKRNFFQQTILAFFQLAAINLTEEIDEHISFKEVFFSEIEGCIYSKFLETHPHKKGYNKFIKKFDDNLTKHLLWIDHNNGEAMIDATRIRFPHNRQGFLLDEDAATSCHKFKSIRRLFFSNEGDLKPIDTLTDFIHCFDDTLSNMQPMETWGSAFQDFQKFISQNRFKKLCAKVIESCNYEEQVDLPWQTYHKSDVLILKTNGGFPSHLIHWISQQGDLKYEMVNIEGKTVEHLFAKICKKLQRYVDQHPLFLKQCNPTVPIDSTDHSFILYPLLFSKFLSSDARPILEQKVLLPARKLYERKPSDAVIKKILFDAFDINFAVELINLLPKAEYMPTMTHFYNAVDRLLSLEEKVKFNHSYGKILTQVTFDQIERQLPFLLSLHGIEATVEVIQDIAKSIAKQLPPTSTSFSLVQLAIAINRAFVINNFSFLSTHQLEDTLADIFELPYVIKLANLNWTDKLGETAQHKLLVIKFDLIRNCCVFYERHIDVDLPLEESFADLLLKQFDLYLPA